MKYSAVLVVGAVASASAATQSYSTIYEYYSDCATTTTGPASTATGTLTYSIGGNVTNMQTDAITICPTCTASPAIVPEGKTIHLTTYTTVYSCPGDNGMEEKTYTITEPCPTPGVPHTAGYIPQGFAVSTVTCTACPGSPAVPVTGPVAEKTAAPGTPGSSSPGAPGSGSSSPGKAGSGSSSPGEAGSGSSSPGAPGSSSPENAKSGSSSPGAPGSGSLSPGSGSSSPGSPGSGSSSPGGSSPGSGSGSGSGSPESGSSSPGSGSSSPGGAAAPPYPLPAGSEARGGAAASGTAAPSGIVAPVTPFKGAATKLFAISLSFVIGVVGFVGFYFI